MICRSPATRAMLCLLLPLSCATEPDYVPQAGGSGGQTGGGSGGQTGGGSGGQTGGGSGGSVATTCTVSGSPAAGSGSLTWYYFGQGTWQENGYYQTACGYRGTEPSGQDSDQMLNIANPGYFAAIPGNSPSDFNTREYCGACVQITNGSKSVIATVTDECPKSSNPLCVTGHLDVSRPAFNALGFSAGNPSGVTWKFVPCPVTGNVKLRIKNGNSNEMYLENVVLPIKSVVMNGVSATRTSYGAWHFDGDIWNNTEITLTDMGGRSIVVKSTTYTQGQDQDTGKQFPACQ